MLTPKDKRAIFDMAVAIGLVAGMILLALLTKKAQ
jgi:hypothetical protein